MTVCLMLHGLGSPPPATPEVERRYWISEDTFELVLGLAKQANSEITIDDGNASDAVIGLPALVRAGLKATFFIPSDRIGTPGYLSPSGVRQLHDAGMIIGSHGCAHLRWTEVSKDAITDEVRRSIQALSAVTQAVVDLIAVPYGACDRRVIGILRNLGIRRVYTSFRGPDGGDAWLVRRDCITNDMSDAEIRRLIEAKPSMLREAFSRLRAWRHAGNAALRHA